MSLRADLRGRCLRAASAAALLLCAAGPARAEVQTQTLNLHCIGYGTSHTARMNFEIEVPRCRVYWRELERTLDVLHCAPPHLVARKPFAPSDHDVFIFDLDTLAFVSRFSSVDDRGHCRPAG